MLFSSLVNLRHNALWQGFSRFSDELLVAITSGFSIFSVSISLIFFGYRYNKTMYL